MEKEKRLFRSRKDKIFGGLCGGIAKYFDIDSVIVRLIWVAFIFTGGWTILAYIIGWIIVPREPEICRPRAKTETEKES
jgi:phage shock protein C